jgi:hypothetical protein
MYKEYDNMYMYESHDKKLVIFKLTVVFVSYCSKFWGSGVIYKGHDTLYMFERDDKKNSSFSLLWPFCELLLPIFGFWGKL